MIVPTRLLVLVWLIGLAAFTPEIAVAQFYKGKTITMVVNYPAGGPTDLEGRIVAQHLPDFLPGRPTIVVKNVGGAGGLIGSNQVGEAAPNGETIGFFTIDVPSQVLENPSLKTPYSKFLFIAGVECPLVVYMRRDTPPGIKTPADLMKTNGFKALSLSAENTNTINMTVALDLLGVKYEPIPAYRGLKEVETAILQNIGQMANSSLSGWSGSVEPSMGNIVLPLWQLSPHRSDGYPRSAALPNIQTFEEFYGSVYPDKPLAGQFRYQILRTMIDPQLAMFRVALMPPNTAEDAVAAMRKAFIDMWKSPQFLADYAKVIRSQPILVTGEDGQKVLDGLGKVRGDVKQFLLKYISDMTSK